MQNKYGFRFVVVNTLLRGKIRGRFAFVFQDLYPVDGHQATWQSSADETFMLKKMLNSVFIY